MKKEEKRNKKGQLFGLSFQFIFSIILIIIFVVVAVVVVKTMIETGEHSKIVYSVTEFKSEVGKSLYIDKVGKNLSLSFPNRIEAICFSDRLLKVRERDLGEKEKAAYQDLEIYKGEDANFYFYPIISVVGYDISPFLKITCGENEFECLTIDVENNFKCFWNKDGIIKIPIEKPFGGEYVKIK